MNASPATILTDEFFVIAPPGPSYVFLADAGQSNQITGCVLPVNSGSYFTS